MTSRTPCGLAAGMNGKLDIRKFGFDLQVGNEIGETPCALGSGIVNFKDFLYTVIFYGAVLPDIWGLSYNTLTN